MAPETVTMIVGLGGLASTTGTAVLTLMLTGRREKARAEIDASREQVRMQQAVVDRWTADRKQAYGTFLREMDELRRAAWEARRRVNDGEDYDLDDFLPLIGRCHLAYLEAGLLASDDLKDASATLWSMIFGEPPALEALAFVHEPDWETHHDRFKEQYGLVLTVCQRDLGIPT
jgi:hypothetical protein